MTIGEQIKNLRLEKGYDQQDICTFLNIEQSTLSNYENDRRVPKPDMISKMADFFGVTTDYILGRTTNIKLTKKDKMEIDEYLNNFENELLSQTGLMFDGEPMTQESKEKLIAAMRIGAEMAKKEAKEKYTPKKFRK